MKYTLDDWDYKLIDISKSSNLPLDKIQLCKELWAERNGVDVNHMHLQYIIEQLCDIVYDLPVHNSGNPIRDLYVHLNPSKDWMFGTLVPPESINESEYDIRWFSRLLSFVCGRLVSDVEGYREYIDKRGPRNIVTESEYEIRRC